MRIRNVPILLAALVALLGLTPGSLTAQTSNAAIVGDVMDETGALVPGANVMVTNVATGVQRSLTTNERGAFRAYPVQPGTYDVAASSEGFKTNIRAGIVVEVAATVKVDLALELGQVTETVEVTGQVPVLQTQDASVGGTVTNTEIERIPVNGRNYTRLILMMPGTSGMTYSQSRGTQSGTFLISVNGARPQDNNFTMDGVDNNMMMMNSPGASPPMDAIQEFRVATNNNAEFGRSMGANVNIAIKSGTRDLHGTAYWYVRNDKFDANTFFANRSGTGRVPFRQNQFGGALGGPVPGMRDSTFWFFNWEGFRRNRGSNAFGNFPTPQQRSGDFSELAQTIYNPFTGMADGAGKVQRDPFPNNAIPQSLHHPSILTFLDIMIPLPTRPGLTQNYVNTTSASNQRDFFVARGDHQAGEKDSFSVRYLHQNVSQFAPSSNPHLSRENDFDVRNLSGQWTRLVNPSSILEVRFGYNAPWNPNCTLNSAIDRPSFLDRTGIQMFQRDVLCSPIPNMSSDGEFSAGGGGTNTGDKVWQFISNYATHVGGHSVKFGVNYSRRHFYTNTSNPMNGNLWFNGELTSHPDDATSGFSTASMLLGLPRQFRRSTGETITNGRINAWQFFVQDDWRVTSNLTINLGMRYEYNNPPYDTSDQLGNLWLTDNPVTGNLGRLMWSTVNPEVDPETGNRGEPARRLGTARSLMIPDRNNFAPRAGIAYQVDRKTVIRTGVGVFYNSTFVQELQDLRKFWPYVPQQVATVNTITADAPRPTFFADNPGPPYSSTAAIGGWPQQPTNRSPYSVQWNFFIQRELVDQLSLNVGYVGSSSRKQIGYTAINTPLTPGPGAIQPRRYMPDFGNLDGGFNRFAGQYNSMQVELNKRFGRGFGFRMNYTWSKAMDEQSSLAEWKTQDPFNIRNDWSRSSWDLQHVFQVAYQWDLPFGRDRKWGSSWSPAANAVLGGWALEGFTRFNTGPPVNVRSGRDIANVGRAYQRPDVTCDPNNGPKTAEQWYQVSCFEFPQQYMYGNAGAFIVQAQGINSWDVSVAKHFQLTEGQRITFRGEFFNAFNKTHFRKPGNRIYDTLAAGSVGKIFSLQLDPRQIQFVLRYEF